MRKLVALLWTLAAVPGGAATNNLTPFLTEVEHHSPETWGFDSQDKRNRYYAFPVAAGVTQPYHDMPFALHVPFDVPFDSGPVQAWFHVTFGWDEPEARHFADRIAFRTNGLVVQQMGAGLYRADRAEIPPQFAPLSASKDPVPLMRVAQAPWPLWLRTSSEEPGRPETINRSRNLRAHEPPFGLTAGNDTPGKIGNCDGYVLRSPKPGVHVAWWAMCVDWHSFILGNALAWPVKPLRPDDTLRGRFRVHYIVARRDFGTGAARPFPTAADVAYLLEKRGAKPDGLADEKFYRAGTVELPVVFRRNGWVLDRVAVEPISREMSEWMKTIESTSPQVNSRHQARRRAAAVEIKKPGATMTLTSHAFARETDYRVSPPSAAFVPHSDLQSVWNVQLPRVIRDEGVADVTATVQSAFTPHRTSATNEMAVHAESGIGWYWNPAATNAKSWIVFNNSPQRLDGELPWLHGGMNEELRGRLLTDLWTEPAGYGMGAILNPEGMSREMYLKDVGAARGDTDGTHWMPIHDPALPGRFQIKLGLQSIPRCARELYYPFAVSNGVSRVLVSFRFGPWIVDGYYQRLKDLDKLGSAVNLDDKGGPVVKEQDPFWKWFPGYSQRLEERLDEIMAARLQAMVAGMELQGLLRTQRDVARQLADPTIEATQRRVATELGKVTGEKIKSLRARHAGYRDVAQVMADAIVNDIADGYARFGENHPELLLQKKAYQELADRLPFQMAIAGGDRELLRDAVAKAEAGRFDNHVRILRARLDWEDGKAFDALDDVRELLKAFPNDADARGLLKEIEVAFLQAALEKSQGAIAKARGAFHTYLRERGFSDLETNRVVNSSWYCILAAPRAALDNESAWAIFTTGVTGSISSLLGRQRYEARYLETVEKEMTAQFLGLHAIIRLRMRGHSLQEIAGMTTPQIKAALPLKQPNGEPYLDSDFKLLGVAMQQGLKLPEVRALAFGSIADLRQAVKESRWDEADIGGTWTEWFGDLSSPKNLFLTLLPMSYGRAAGGGLVRSGFWSANEAAVYAASVDAGLVGSGSELLAQMARLDRVLARIGNTPAGAALAGVLERQDKWEQGLSGVGYASWALSKCIGSMILQGTAIHLAEAQGGPAAGLAAESLLMLGTDSAMIARLLKRNGIPPTVAATALAGPVARNFEQQAAKLNLTADDAQKILTAIKRIQKHETLAPGDLQLAAKMRDDWRKIMPGSSAVEDAEIAMIAALEGIAGGVDNGAGAAAHAISSRLKEQAEAAKKKMDRVRALGEELSKLEQFDDEMRLARPLDRGSGTLPGAPAAHGGYDLPPQPSRPGPIALAETALDAGDLDRAEHLYVGVIRNYLEAARAGQELMRGELPFHMLNLRMRLILELKNCPKPKPLPTDLTRPIDEADVDRLLALPRKRLANQGASGVAAEVKDASGSYILKEIVVGEGSLIQTEGDLAAALEGEVVSEALNRLFGIDAPGMTYRAHWKDGRLTGATLIYRKIDGEILENLSLAEIYHQREALSRHRALAVLLNDFDRKSDNYMVSGGRLFAIDGGMADPRGRFARVRQVEGAGVDALMAGRNGRDHWYWRTYFHHYKREGAWDAAMEKRFLAETILSHNHAKPLINEIVRELQSGEKVRARLIEAYTTIQRNNPNAPKDPAVFRRAVESMADEALETLRQRAEHLDPVMRGLNDRNGITPLPFSWLRFGPALRLWNQMRDGLSVPFHDEEIALAA